MNNISEIERFDIIGCKFSRVNKETTAKAILSNINNKVGGYVCFTNVHATVMGRQDAFYKNILNDSFLTVPDGKPIYWYAKIHDYKDVGHVPGPDFMPEFIANEKCKQVKHFFYGSTNKVLEKLINNIKVAIPDLIIVGHYSPPFRTLSKEESTEVVEMINLSRPDIVWVGLGAPKQEIWMMENQVALKPAILMGVGAAFDFQAGTLKRAPAVFTKFGLEWLFRLSQEPKRLFKRYLVSNALFVWYILIDFYK